MNVVPVKMMMVHVVQRLARLHLSVVMVIELNLVLSVVLVLVVATCAAAATHLIVIPSRRSMRHLRWRCLMGIVALWSI